jgi:hypothetical protein
MVFNVFVSPVLYYQAPRRILTNIRFRDFVFFYTIPFIIGLCFRFLDDIPVLATFVLDPERITTEPQKIMFGCLAAGIVIGVLYYIFVSLNPWTNLIIFSVAVAFIAGTTYTFFIRGMDIHVHHYFLGLIMMVVSSNYHSKLIIIIHAIGYALYIEGLSRWGIGPNYYY